MEFKKERVYSAVNADELKPGDKVIVADNLADLKEFVRKNDVHEIEDILSDCVNERFGVCGMANYALAYLVERKENCTNCGCVYCWYRKKHRIDEQRLHTCSKRIESKTEQKVEKQYRPFVNTDELIKVWDAKYKEKYGLGRIDKGLDMPYIWVKKHDDTDRGKLIISFSNNGCSVIDVDEIEVLLWEDLFNIYTFLDGSPCGVKE